MRTRSLGLAAALVALVACGDNGGQAPDAPGNAGTDPIELGFGPYTIPAETEVTDQCVQISLNNETDLYVNAVELTTGAGFHHSNWFYVPQTIFDGDNASDSGDGTYTCADRGFSEPAAAIFGGVLFAQSTQAPHEVQQFPEGVVIHIPAHYKLVAQIHLLNPTEQDLQLTPSITLTPIAESDVTTKLSAISFEDHALGLPPNAQSSFSVDCDLSQASQNATGGPPDFKIYYALAHYHSLGTGMKVEALKDDDTTAATIYSTENHIGDALGGMIAPAFDMTGYSHLKFECDYYNDRSDTVRWGVGDQEMCVFLAFSDSKFNWGGGATMDGPPGDPTDVNGVQSFTHECTVFANPAMQ